MLIRFFSLCGAFRSVPSGVGPRGVDRPAPPQPAAARGHPDPPPAGRGRGLWRQQRGAQRPQLLPSGDLISAVERELARSAARTCADGRSLRSCGLNQLGWPNNTFELKPGFSGFFFLLRAENKREKLNLTVVVIFCTLADALIYIPDRTLKTMSQKPQTCAKNGYSGMHFHDRRIYFDGVPLKQKPHRIQTASALSLSLTLSLVAISITSH